MERAEVLRCEKETALKELAQVNIIYHHIIIPRNY